jgi:VanZ family protein
MNRASGGPARPILTWAPVVAWAGLVFALSAQPDLRFLPDDALDFAVRKVGHAGVFGILALLLWRALATTTSRHPAFAWALALTILYAVTDELHQGVVNGRHASPVDVGVDAFGAVIAVGVALYLQVRRVGRGQ